MAVQQVVNHIHNGVDFVVEHAETDSDMVLHDNNKLSDFIRNMFPITGGNINGNLGITGYMHVNGTALFRSNVTLNQELLITDYYNSNGKKCSIWFNGRDGENLLFDRVNELQLNTGGIKCKTHVKSQWGFLQNLPNGSTPLMEGRDGGGYALGWYFSDAKGAFIDLYAKNVQNQCDERVKDIVPETKDMKASPNPVENITPKRYRYFGEEKIRYGFIAQEIEQYVPEAVTTLNYSPDETNIPRDKHGNKLLDCKTVDLMALVATLWTKVQELSLEVNTLKELVKNK